MFILYVCMYTCLVDIYMRKPGEIGGLGKWKENFNDMGDRITLIQAEC